LTYRDTYGAAATFVGFLTVVSLRGWSGLDQIPSDPGYDALEERIGRAWRIVEFDPYLHADQTMVASLASLLPREIHGFFTTTSSHLIWSCCAVVMVMAFRRHGFGSLVAIIAGLLLVMNPWASQSAIGNYGNIRWPILVAAAVVVSLESVARNPHRGWLLATSAIAAISNPLHPLLLLPLAVGFRRSSRTSRSTYLIATTPLVVGLIVNVINSDEVGHATKLRAFWPGAGLFWTSGQLLPSLIALLGIVVGSYTMRASRNRQLLVLLLFILAIAFAGAGYVLGGIADRYFVAPSVLALIGALILVTDAIRGEIAWSRVGAVTLAVLLLVPTIRWFFVSPWLRTGPAWSSQVRSARAGCADGSRLRVELTTSNGETRTVSIPCRDF
jgi:hypothetical protein